MRRAILGLPIVAAVVVIGACASRVEVAAPPPRIAASAGAASSIASSAARVANPMDVADPEAERLFREHFEQAPVAFTTDRPPTVTRLALEDTARGEAHGMHVDGDIRVAKLREGQRASRRVSLAKGACATYLAEGGLGVVEVDLFLAVGEASSLRVLAADRRGGPIAVVGGRDGCFKNETGAPLEADLHVVVRRGGGVVLVQGFER